MLCEAADCLMGIHFLCVCSLQGSSSLLGIIFSTAASCGLRGAHSLSGEFCICFSQKHEGHRWPEMSFLGLDLGVSYFEGVIKWNLIFA